MEFDPIGIIHSPHHTKDDCPIQPAYASRRRAVSRSSPSSPPAYRTSRPSATSTSVRLRPRQVRSSWCGPRSSTMLPTACSRRDTRVAPTASASRSFACSKARQRPVVSGIDVLDGTPLLDIKPYMPRYDVVESARWAGRAICHGASNRETESRALRSSKAFGRLAAGLRQKRAAARAAHVRHVSPMLSERG